MLMPIGDEPNPKGTAWANLTLIALNLAIYLFISLPLSFAPVTVDTPELEEFLHEVSRATGQHPLAIARETSQYDVFAFRHGFRPSQPNLADLLFSMFLHGGFAHLLGNLLFLWIFGDNVEHRLGAPRYVLAYLATGVAATLMHASFAEEQSLPLVGASGAISGVLGFYFVWFPANHVRMFLWFYFYVDVFVIPARIVLAFYLIVENLLPYILAQGTSGVAHGAHIGGFLAGWLLAKLLLRGDPRR
jgi:membrane associated rhomboid family serine protease